MSVVNTRSVGRNVHIYDAREPNQELGGLLLTNGVTNKNLYDMVTIILFVDGSFILQHNSNHLAVSEVPKDDTPLLPGDYYVVTAAQIQVNDEQPLSRAVTNATGTRYRPFRHAVRSRDQRCVITGQNPTNPDRGNWNPLQAAHIFPLAYHQHWTEGNFSRWITTPGNGDALNSVQNGILLDAGMHMLFDQYYVSINPDENHKIVFFDRDTYNVAGTHLQPQFLNHPDRTPDELFRWHFRQAVLTNVKGAGEPIFEYDFPPGSDMIGDILNGPMAAERMEYELFTRLAGLQDV